MLIVVFLRPRFVSLLVLHTRTTSGTFALILLAFVFRRAFRRQGSIFFIRYERSITLPRNTFENYTID